MRILAHPPSSSSAERRGSRAQSDSTVFDNLLIQALQGDLPTVMACLNTLHDDSLKASQVEKKQAMVHRFSKQDEREDDLTALSNCPWSACIWPAPRCCKKNTKDLQGAERDP